MPTPVANARLSFGLYEADLQTGELWKAGFRIKLQSQPFKVLTALLERPGQVVTREELQLRLWGRDTVVDFDHSLGTAINKIREALGDSAENPRFIETLSKRGYRFIAPVAVLDAVPELAAPGRPAPSREASNVPVSGITTTLGGAAERESGREGFRHQLRELARRPVPEQPPQPAVEPVPVPESPHQSAGKHSGIAIADPVAATEPGVPLSRNLVYLRRAALIVAGIGLCCLSYFSGWAHSRVSPQRITQVTHNGHFAPAGDVSENLAPSVTDGVHLFAPTLENGRAGLAAITLSGGDIAPLSIPGEVSSPALGDISPDGARLLLRDHLSPESEQPLWIVPTLGGAAQRVGNALAHDATWMPDGRSVLYANGNSLYVTPLTGYSPQVYATVPGRAFWLRWSPDGHLLRFTVLDPIAHTRTLWQLSAANPKPVQLLPGFSHPASECCGVWTADGSAFVFQTSQGTGSDLWELRGSSTSGPLRLTDGPLQFQSPVADRTGNRVYFLGVDARSELKRVTPAGTLAPERGFLSSAVRVDFSRDGKWVAWTDSVGQLWRARADGTQKLQLTPDHLDVFLAHWSPDATHLALMAREPGKAWRLYLTAADGTGLQPLLPEEARNAADPSWSPDGQTVVFGRVNDTLGKENAARTLQLLDLRTRQVTMLPSSDGLFSPRWSPDGRYIAALSLDQRQVRLYDLAGHTWRTLPVPSGADPVWTSDSRFLYLHASLDPAQPIERVSIPDGHVTAVIRLAETPSDDAADYIFSGLTPENAPLIRARVFTGNFFTTAAR